MTFNNYISDKRKEYTIKFNIQRTVEFTQDYQLKQQNTVIVGQPISEINFKISSSDRIDHIRRSMYKQNQQLSGYETILNNDHTGVVLRKYSSFPGSDTITDFGNTLGGKLKLSVQNEKGD